jgi:hypothetical protein
MTKSKIRKTVFWVYQNLPRGKFCGKDFINMVKNNLGGDEKVYNKTILRILRLFRQKKLIEYLILHARKSIYLKVR